MPICTECGKKIESFMDITQIDWSKNLYHSKCVVRTTE